MLKDEVALSKEKMNRINIEPIIQSVIDDYNNIHKVKKDIDVRYENDGKKKYFIKPIQNLVHYTKLIKEKNQTKSNIENLKNRNDELGLLSTSLEDMTNELQKRVTHAENFSTDLVHEIRNPLASLKGCLLYTSPSPRD